MGSYLDSEEPDDPSASLNEEAAQIAAIRNGSLGETREDTFGLSQ